jgi:hypothetical protein
MEKLDLLDGQIQYIKFEDRAKGVNWKHVDNQNDDEEDKKLREMYDDAIGKQVEAPRWVKRSRKLDNDRKLLLQELNFLLHKMEGKHFAAQQVSKAA